MLVLQHATVFLPPTKIIASADYSNIGGSDMVIVTVGARQSRLNLLQRNLALFLKVVRTVAMDLAIAMTTVVRMVDLAMVMMTVVPSTMMMIAGGIWARWDLGNVFWHLVLYGGL
ncbi:hypothetical protein QVD17_20474 [Tagetes erecta]|uniref:Lactate/malate dehydrogenase N-terminal domain-containing protein n=1 Tax=Tagetes erecta TaxID=13708 RepID=A0AAD8KLA1_TARER|nr:hypothetical protein QVD17_20474 [Tagetes erecta]